MNLQQLILCWVHTTAAHEAIQMAFALALTVVLMGISWWTFASGEHVRQMRRRLAEQDAEIARIKAGWAKSVAGE